MRKLVAAGGLVMLRAIEGILWAQCAMCRTALVSSPEGQQWAVGFNRGIILLLVAPFLVLGAIAAALWRARRKTARRASALRAESPAALRGPQPIV